MANRRWERLRKYQAYPMNRREVNYVLALDNYVRFKIDLHRYNRQEIYRGDKAYLEEQMYKWRTQMDLIEYGLIEELNAGYFHESDEIAKSVRQQICGVVSTRDGFPPYSSSRLLVKLLVKRNHDVDDGTSSQRLGD